MNAQFLKQIPIFSELNNKEVEIVLDALDLKKFKKDDIVMRQGNEGFGMHIIIAGRVSVERDGETVAELGENAFFGEMALVADEPRSATVKVISEDLVTLFLSRVVFKGIKKSLNDEIKNEILNRNMQNKGPNFRAPFNFF